MYFKYHLSVQTLNHISKRVLLLVKNFNCNHRSITENFIIKADLCSDTVMCNSPKVPLLLPSQLLLVSPDSLPLCPAEKTVVETFVKDRLSRIIVVDYNLDLGLNHFNSRSIYKLFWSFQPHLTVLHQ